MSALAHDPAPASYPLLQALSLPLPRTFVLALAHDPTSDQLLPSSPLLRPSERLHALLISLFFQEHPKEGGKLVALFPVRLLMLYMIL